MLLIIGIDSLLGTALARSANLYGMPWQGTSRRMGCKWRLDLSESPEKWQLPHDSKTAIICAGITKISLCENNPESTRLVNVDATYELASRLNANGCRVALLSSTQVFDPHLSAPPDESSVPSPFNQYGRQKVQLEREILSLAPENLVIRLTKVVHGNMPLVQGWKQRWGRGEPVDAYLDYYLAPISQDFFASSTMDILEAETGGVFHLGPMDVISYYEFAKWIAGFWNISVELVNPAHSPSPHSPQSAMLDCRHSARSIGLSIPTAHESLSSAFACTAAPILVS